MPRPTHFEIHAADFDRVQAFYAALFGWTFADVGMPDYRAIDTGAGEGINGGLIRRMGPNPDPSAPTPVVGYICTHNVDDLDACMAKAVALGGSVALPRMEIPGVGALGYLKDTESNIFGVLQPIEDAG
jgi:predicted enzyme related to lactoylglutathione lyase